MAITKVSRGLLNTGISDSSDATAITIDSSENITLGVTNPVQISTNIMHGTSGSNGFYVRTALSSATVPTFSNIDDTNTGMFFPAADTVGFTTAGTERARFTSNGLTFNGDTAAANALDDYEEGTFTPTISAGGVTYSYQVGWYTKIGNLVNVGIHLDVNTNSNASGTAVAITLPFTSSYSNAQAYSMTSAVWCNGWASTPKADIGLLGHNASAVTFYYNNGTGLAASTQGQLGGGNMLFNIQYTTA